MRAARIAGLTLLSACASLRQPVPVDQAQPGVAVIVAQRSDGKYQAGSGPVLSDDGLVLTNAHVLIDERGRPLGELHVLLPASSNNTRYRARLLALSATSALDLALLQFDDPPPGLTVLALSRQPPTAGEGLFLVGHPGGRPGTTILEGKILKAAPDGPILLITPFLAEGESGSPLLDRNGQIVGLGCRVEPGPNPPETARSIAISAPAIRAWLQQIGHPLREP